MSPYMIASVKFSASSWFADIVVLEDIFLCNVQSLMRKGWRPLYRSDFLHSVVAFTLHMALALSSLFRIRRLPRGTSGQGSSQWALLLAL